jgi:hypothetical protein
MVKIQMDYKEVGHGLDSSGLGYNPVTGCFEPNNDIF